MARGAQPDFPTRLSQLTTILGLNDSTVAADVGLAHKIMQAQALCIKRSPEFRAAITIILARLIETSRVEQEHVSQQAFFEHASILASANYISPAAHQVAAWLESLDGRPRAQHREALVATAMGLRSIVLREALR